MFYASCVVTNEDIAKLRDYHHMATENASMAACISQYESQNNLLTARHEEDRQRIESLSNECRMKERLEGSNLMLRQNIQTLKRRNDELLAQNKSLSETLREVNCRLEDYERRLVTMKTRLEEEQEERRQDLARYEHQHTCAVASRDFRANAIQRQLRKLNEDRAGIWNIPGMNPEEEIEPLREQALRIGVPETTTVSEAHKDFMEKHEKALVNDPTYKSISDVMDARLLMMFADRKRYLYGIEGVQKSTAQ